MKAFFWAIGIVSLALPSLATAQSKNFEGFAVGLNAGFDSTATKLTASGTVLDSIGKSNTIANVNGSYTFAVNENITLAISAAYNLTDSKIYSDGGGPIFNDVLKLKSQYAISIEPGYALNDSTLGYIKLGYHSADHTVQTISKSANGTGYGFGVKYLISPNVYANLELLRVDYSSSALDSSVTAKTINTIGTVGIGYKF